MRKFVGIYFIMIVILSSCSGFSNNMLKNDVSVISKENVSGIDGQYESNIYEGKGEAPAVLSIKNLNREGCDRFIIKSVPLDKKDTYELQFKLLKKDTVKYILKYRVYPKNGFLMLDNYSSKCSGIPYLFGSCEKSQSRIGLTKDQNFFIQDYYKSSGGALLFMWTGYTSNSTKKYRRIK